MQNLEIQNISFNFSNDFTETDVFRFHKNIELLAENFQQFIEEESIQCLDNVVPLWKTKIQTFSEHLFPELEIT